MRGLHFSQMFDDSASLLLLSLQVLAPLIKFSVLSVADLEKSLGDSSMNPNTAADFFVELAVRLTKPKKLIQ
jgi:hypothetical protein